MVPEQVTQFALTGVLNTMISIEQLKPNTFINDYFKDIYVITTTHNKLRQSNIQAKLKAMGINYTLCIMNVPSAQLYSIYESWYHEFILPQERAIERKPTNFAKLSLGELGCCASHMYVLNHIATKSESSKSLVLEDDVIFIKQFEDRVKNALPNISNCDFFALGTNDYNIKSRNVIKNPHLSSNQYIYSPNPEQGIFYGMHAYTLVPNSAKQFISYINTFVRPCDHYLWLMFATAKAGQALTIWPPLIIQDRTSSSLRDVTTEKNTEQYYFEKCLPGLDKDMYEIQNKSQNSQNSENSENSQNSQNKPITVILTYFNPVSYISRKANLEYMLSQLITYPVDEIILVTPSCTMPKLLLPVDKRIKLVEIETESILFHKESLQNKGWKTAKKTNPYIIFMDTDIVFETDWTAQLISELEKNDIVQAWHKATLLDQYNNPVTTEQSWASIASIKPKSQDVTSFKAHTGFAWAFRRDFLELIEDLNIHCVIGSGDQILARALLNTEIQPRHSYMKIAYEDFTKRVQKNLQRGFGYLENVNIKHLYHGALENRRYYERHLYLTNINFNESELIKRDNMIEFKNPEKWNQHFQKYFAERDEDNGFYTHCMVQKGDHVECACPVKKSDILIIIENNTEETYMKLLKIAELHQESSLFIHENSKSGILSDNISCIDSLTKDKLSSHVLNKYIL